MEPFLVESRFGAGRGGVSLALAVRWVPPQVGLRRHLRFIVSHTCGDKRSGISTSRAGYRQAERDVNERSRMRYWQEHNTINPWGVMQQQSELHWSSSFLAATTPPRSKQSVIRGSTTGRSKLRQSCPYLIMAAASLGILVKADFGYW